MRNLTRAISMLLACRLSMHLIAVSRRDNVLVSYYLSSSRIGTPLGSLFERTAMRRNAEEFDGSTLIDSPRWLMTNWQRHVVLQFQSVSPGKCELRKEEAMCVCIYAFGLVSIDQNLCFPRNLIGCFWVS